MREKDFFRTLLLGLSILGILLTLFIAVGTRVESLAELCGGPESGCAQVEASPYSSLFGVPLTWLGLLSYGILIFLLLFWKSGFLPWASFLFGSELYLVYIQWQVIQRFCLFCMIQFGVVFVIFLLSIFWFFKTEPTSGDRRRRTAFTAAAVPLFVVLGLVPIWANHRAQASSLPPQTVSAIPAGPQRGNPDSPLVLEIFSDYQCGYCRNFEPVLLDVEKKFPHIRIVFRDYLIRSHPLSPMATAYADWIFFKDGPEAYFKVRDEIFQNQPTLQQYLAERFKGEGWTEEMQKKVKEKVNGDLARAGQLNVNSTPTTVVFRQGEIVKIFRGAVPLEELEAFLKSM